MTSGFTLYTHYTAGLPQGLCEHLICGKQGMRWAIYSPICLCCWHKSERCARFRSTSSPWVYIEMSGLGSSSCRCQKQFFWRLTPPCSVRGWPNLTGPTVVVLRNELRDSGPGLSPRTKTKTNTTKIYLMPGPEYICRTLWQRGNALTITSPKMQTLTLLFTL